MSDLEAQNGSSNFNGLTASLVDVLLDASTKVNGIQKLMSRQKAQKKASKLDHRIIDMVEEAAELMKIAREELVLITDWDSKLLTRQQQLSKDRLDREFKQLLSQFQGQQRELAEIQRSVLIEARKNMADAKSNSTEQTPLLKSTKNAEGANNIWGSDNYGGVTLDGHQQQTQILDVVRQDDIDFQQSLIREREAEIQNIQQGISEINSIFKDLGTLVTQQGEQVDSFEDNITDIAGNTRNAVDELLAANEYQRKRRNWSMCVLIVLIVVLVLIFLVLSINS